MIRRAASIAVATALVCLLFATVSTSGGVNLWGEPQWDPTPRERDPIELEIAVDGDDPFELADATDDDPLVIPAWIRAVLQVILVGVVAAAAVALALAAWRNRPRLRWRRRQANGDFEVLPDVAAAVVGQAAVQRAALLDGAPRNAIVQCWLQLERDVVAAGLHRDPADTSLEFTERVLARYTVDSEAIEDLAARYREARFSDHQLDESDRDAALAALERLHRTLAATQADTPADAQLGAAT
jgi:hypothetical protein